MCTEFTFGGILRWATSRKVSEALELGGDSSMTSFWFSEAMARRMDSPISGGNQQVEMRVRVERFLYYWFGHGSGWGGSACCVLKPRCMRL
ncbi:hypothetical protein LIER_10897 [Lithospermum erythrorhizon]|uniref:Uncharacterized protein n=1 Tax=Lithospermum erythrorhizon TaxID=34254 RepID=A0AAV3PMB7_LITER